jgi:catechol 2,3-dioxygenase-like lactoylglutathione lyase family enzyme
MAGPVDASLRKFHASLNVSDLDRSVAFYRVLFGLEPAKVRANYAKFELAEPPLVLSLIPGRPVSGGHLNHVGLRVRTSEELVEIQHRLEAAGTPTRREDGVACCYARQTKFWVTDPDRALWEIYVFHEDIEDDDHDHDDLMQTSTTGQQEARDDANRHMGAEAAQGGGAGAGAAALTWSHRLAEAVPARIPHDDNSVRDIELEGTINSDPAAPHRAGLLADAYRVLKPGAELHVHGLAGDAPCARGAGELGLPGPAAAVQHVPASADVVNELKGAGFVDIRFETLSKTAYFNIDGVGMREVRVSARKPGHRPRAATHRAVYLGPMAEVTDDFGNTFRRGEPTPLNVHDWQVLSKSAASSSFLFLEPEKVSLGDPDARESRLAGPPAPVAAMPTTAAKSGESGKVIPLATSADANGIL